MSVVERVGLPPAPGGRFAAVFPHSDDLAIFVGGTVLKLLADGWSGVFIKTTNDDKDSYDLPASVTASRIHDETRELGDLLGLERVLELDYQNHYLQPSTLVELRHRLIVLFRLLRVDAVLTFDPWAPYEENPDHVITAQATEAACWMAGRHLDLPELGGLGIRPHRVRRRYYVARGPQVANHVVDIDAVLERKRAAVLLHHTPLDHMRRLHRDAVGPDLLAPTMEEFVDRHVLAGEPRESFRVIDDVAGPWTERGADGLL